MPNSGTIFFNGRSSADIGVFLTKEPELIRPDRKFMTIPVPGRNGDIIITEDAWNNYEQTFEIGYGSREPGAVSDMTNDLFSWLNSANGYARLETSLEPDVFRLAYVVNGAEVVNHMNRIGEASLTFNCRPERFLKAGEDNGGDVGGVTNPIVKADGTGQIMNPTVYSSKPVLYIAPQSTSGSLTITAESGETYTVEVSTSNIGIVIDCETGNATWADGTDANSAVGFGYSGLPRLEPGTSVFDGSLVYDNVYIAPRWFVI